ncbi:hypothetical protein JZO73_10360 [Enterococcus plantarum]|uniref:hypothetical protein n=1 Tax=Enterococcus plantarum TaxID=1077675 RepID=UPI001A8F2BE9|nr:hypothetical protein [Enterococcus plantarum]MBO0467933.1 hypothetical protein [Enterococcus plantarum]
MAKLSDYGIIVDDLTNSQTVTIQGHDFPIVFTMETMEYIADIYGGDYSKFEDDMNVMIEKSNGEINSKNLTAPDLKIMRALIYGMLKTGGLDESPSTIFKFLGMNSSVLEIYAVCMEIFSDQSFQVEDLKKSRKPQDYQTTQRKVSKKRKNYKKK